MKKNLFILAFGLLLTSCATSIKTSKNVEPFELRNLLNADINMDFIGFKIDSNILSTTSDTKVDLGVWVPNVKNIMSEFDQAKAISNSDSLKKLGYILENHGIANDMSSTYFGIYSLQEMELYKSKNRYVTFVEVAQSKLYCNENNTSKNVLDGLSAGFLTAGIPLDILGGVWNSSIDDHTVGNIYLGMGIACTAIGAICLVPALLPTRTKIDFTGVYNVYLYDTQTKAIIRKDAVSVKVNEKFTGSYSKDEQSKGIVHDYISRHISNAILQKYEELNNWLVRSKK